jgi:hypothetical protein
MLHNTTKVVSLVACIVTIVMYRMGLLTPIAFVISLTVVTLMGLSMYLLDWLIRGWSMPESSFAGCGSPTHYAFVILDDSEERLGRDRLFNLSKQPWDYTTIRECGAAVDNVDAVLTYYICPSCLKQFGYHGPLP